LRTGSTDAVASAVAASLLPLQINAASAIAKASPGAKGKAAATKKLEADVSDLTLSLRELRVEKKAGTAHQVDVAVELRKAKEAEPLTAEAVLSVVAKPDCANGHHQLTVRPTLTHLKLSKLPSWLMGGTVLRIVNSMLSSATPDSTCLSGDCKAAPASARH
jgi:hypothetical protein